MGFPLKPFYAVDHTGMSKSPHIGVVGQARAPRQHGSFRVQGFWLIVPLKSYVGEYEIFGCLIKVLRNSIAEDLESLAFG